MFSFDEMIQNPELGATWKCCHKYFTGKDLITDEGVKIIELMKTCIEDRCSGNIVDVESFTYSSMDL